MFCLAMSQAKPTSSKSAPGPDRLELSEAQFEALLQRLEQGGLSIEDKELIRKVIQAVLWMGEELEQKKLSIQRLKRLFGVKTESLANLFPGGAGAGGSGDNGPSGPSADNAASGGTAPAAKPAAPGHGRMGADAFPDAACIFHPHASLKSGERCPDCRRGNLYELDPGTVLRLRGQAPFEAEIHQPERLRCSTCGKVFTAQLPEDLRLSGSGRADCQAHSLLALFRYGSGMPMYRIEGLQKALGIPLPSSTQWDMLERLGNIAYPVYRAMLKLAASGVQFHNDDTNVKVLDLIKRIREEDRERTGIFTTGILSQLPEALGSHRIVLFFSGNQHAGENIRRVLEGRPEGLPMPRLMCDALSRNEPQGITMETAFCLDHARRGFVDVTVQFPSETRFFLEQLSRVYQADSETRMMGETERLAHHQEKSLPVMEALRDWGANLIESRTVEPNSGLGQAIRYFNKHWAKLTSFCRIPGAPLSNTIIERLLKRAILHRKNSLFYKTEAGAWIGDILMSLIETARLAGVNVLDYLTAIQEHAEAARASPEKFMPWNYPKASKSSGKSRAA